MDRAEKILRERFPRVAGLFPDTIKMLRRLQRETRLETLDHCAAMDDIGDVNKALIAEREGSSIIDWDTFEINGMED